MGSSTRRLRRRNSHSMVTGSTTAAKPASIQGFASRLLTRESYHPVPLSGGIIRAGAPPV